MKILVVTRGCWDKSNNTGNTMDNFFGSFKDAEIHNVYLRSELPKTNPCKSIYRISEQELIKSIFSRKKCGNIVSNQPVDENAIEKEASMYERARKTRFFFPWFIREAFWTFGKWKHGGFEKYLRDISPDVIFMPVFACWYPFKIIKYIKKITNAKIVLFHADDNYTLKQHSLSPLFWIYRFNLRRWIRKTERVASIDYAISDLQCREYSKAFKKNIKILYKGQKFDTMPEIKKPGDVIKMVFTGNISVGRYKTLALIGQALDKINENSKRIELDIYTKTSLTKDMKKRLACKSINFKGGISPDEVMTVQKQADILVHAEDFGRKNKLLVRQSFSTKIVDYLYNAKCVFAIGPSDVASIDYLKKNDCAIIADNKKTVEAVLRGIVAKPEQICNYAVRAWECGRKNHQIDEIQKGLYEDFSRLVEN